MFQYWHIKSKHNFAGRSFQVDIPSICSDIMPMLRKTAPSFWCAMDLRRSATSFGMFSVTFTLFHGSTFLTTSCSVPGAILYHMIHNTSICLVYMMGEWLVWMRSAKTMLINISKAHGYSHSFVKTHVLLEYTHCEDKWANGWVTCGYSWL